LKRLPKLPGSLLLGSLLWLALLASCNKDPYEVGLDLLPPSDTLYVSQFDTVTVVAYSEREDSVRSDEMSALMLGSILDPVFGKTTASFYTQFLLSSESIDFGVNPRLDSLVLLLYYDSWFGDTNTLQQVRVFEMSEDISYDSNYYSNQQAGTYGIELANTTYKPRPTDSVTIWGEKVAPHLRINLSNSTSYLGNKILFAPEDVLSSNAAFINFMKGLYVEAIPVNGNGALITYVPIDGLSKMVLYFHNDDNDSLHFNLPIDNTAARFNTFDHNEYLEAAPDFKQQVIYKDTALGRNQLYLQTLGGVKVRIRFPYIRSLADSLGTIAINNAVLKLKNPENDTTWDPPSQLALYKVDSTGKIGALLDYVEGISYFGGTYNSDEQEYWFRLTRHIQNLLINDTLINYDLVLYASDPLIKAPSANRVLLNGTNPFYSPSPGDNLHLEIIYTKLQ